MTSPNTPGTPRAAYLLAIDKGTSVMKALLFDAAGREVAAARRPSKTLNPRPGWHEDDLELAWIEIGELVREVLRAGGVPGEAVAAVGVTAHMGGLVLLDAAGELVRPAVLWTDARAGPVLDRWRRDGVLDRLIEVGGQALLPGLAVPLVAWFDENERSSLERAATFCTTKDYLVLKLSGQLGTDETDAGWIPGDYSLRGHSADVQRLAGVAEHAHLFPTVRTSASVVGHVTAEAAAVLGLSEDAVVVAGLGDANASTVGSGAASAGQAASIVGTSLLNNLVVARPVVEPAGIGFLLPHVDDTWLRMLPNTGGGSVNLRWLAETMYHGSADAYAAMEAEARLEPIGARGVTYHPYLNESGVVAPFYNLGARGQFSGLNVTTTRATMARAVFEGVALSIVDCYRATPVPVEEVRLSGGAARSRVLCQVVADALGIRVLVPDGEESAAKGAAMAAAVGAGLYPDFAAGAQSFVSVRETYQPDASKHEAYLESYERFRQIRQAMAAVWRGPSGEEAGDATS